VSQVRAAIRPALRLARSGSILYLHLDPDECDYLTAVRDANRVLRDDAPLDRTVFARLDDLLGRPLLAGGYADWIADAQAHVDVIRNALARRVILAT
jgi:hypothetical protein